MMGDKKFWRDKKITTAETDARHYMAETVQTVSIESDIDLSKYHVGRIVFFEMTPWETDSPKYKNKPTIMVGQIHAMRMNKIINATANDIICTINAIAFADTGSAFPGTIALPVSELYTSRPELDRAKSDSAEITKTKYRKEIVCVTDLVRFMFNHDMSDKPDNYALQVAKEKATSLLGITFEKNDQKSDGPDWFDHPDNPNCRKE